MTTLREIRPTRKYVTHPDRFDDDAPAEPETRAATDAERAMLKNPYYRELAADTSDRAKITAILERAMNDAGFMPQVHRDGVMTISAGKFFWTVELETFPRVARNA